MPRSFAAALLATVLLGWAICTVAQVEKYLGVSLGLLVTGMGGVGVLLLMLFLRHSFRIGSDLGSWAPWCVLVLIFLSFAILYPKSLHPLPGKGSDREDALRVELQAVTHHQYPYAARTFLNHPPTPLPGAMWLALPFYATARIAFQNLAWLILFTLFLSRYFARNASAAAFLLLFLLLAPENLNDFDVGGDYLTNALYIIVALALFTKAIRASLPAWGTVLSIILLGVALSSRALYAVTLPPLLFFGIRQGAGRRTLMMLGGALLVCACVTIPVFLPHPVRSFALQMAQNVDKLRFLPWFLPSKLLVLAAFVIASMGIFLPRMELTHVFGLAGAAASVLLFIPMVFVVANEGGLHQPLTPDLEYIAPAALFLGLWALARWEKDSVPHGHLFNDRTSAPTCEVRG